MKFTLSGGGAISPDVQVGENHPTAEGFRSGFLECQEWVRTAFGCPLIQGYGWMLTMWGPLVISWFISPNNYSYKYHKP